jgi:hypothetical protein
MNNKIRTVDLKQLRNVTGGAAGGNWSDWNKGSSWNSGSWNTGSTGSNWNWK